MSDILERCEVGSHHDTACCGCMSGGTVVEQSRLHYCVVDLLDDLSEESLVVNGIRSLS